MRPRIQTRSIAGVEDDRPDPCFRSIHARSSGEPMLRFLMIDVKARQQEQARHPEDDEGDVRRFDPKVSGAEKSGQIAQRFPFTWRSMS